jgi:hypothetical protein
MTDTAKTRLAIDLDEIERQLSQASQQPSAPKNDPLSELARIVGQDDPFRALLAGERGRGAPSRPAEGGDDVYAYEPASYRHADPAPLGARGAAPKHAPSSFDDFLEDAEPHVYADRRHGSAPAPAAQPDYDESAWDAPEADAYVSEQPAPRRSRKNLVTVVGVLGMAAVGVASALMLSGGKVTTADGTPPLVTAAEGPQKVAPNTPDGVEIPNQNKQIYERAQDEKTRIVNREEQPIDVQQAARETPRVVLPAPAGAPSSAPSAEAAAAPSNANAAAPPSNVVAALGEPRRVRTVSVRPDGTIVGSDASEPAPARPAALTAAAPVVPAPPPAAVPAPAPVPKPAAPATPAVTGATAPATAGTPPAEAAAKPVQTASAVATPPPPRPSALPPPATPAARMAAVAPTAPAQTAAPEPVISGGYAVQLAIRNSEERARQAFADMRDKFGGPLAGASPIIRKAEFNGNTIFRVRAGPYASMDEANAACASIKSAGGDCFVAKN